MCFNLLVEGIDMAEGRYHWSNTAMTAKFFIIPAECALPWLLLLVYPRWSTMYLAIFLTGLFLYLELVKKMSAFDFLRRIRVKLLGRTRGTTSRFGKFK